MHLDNREMMRRRYGDALDALSDLGLGPAGVTPAVEVHEGLAPTPDEDEVEFVDGNEVEDPEVPFDFSVVSFAMPDPERDAMMLAEAMSGARQVQVIGTAGDDSFFDAPPVQEIPASTDREWT